jgi:hypothetical protein
MASHDSYQGLTGGTGSKHGQLSSAIKQENSAVGAYEIL